MKGAELGRQEIEALLDALSERLGVRGAFAIQARREGEGAGLVALLMMLVSSR